MITIEKESGGIRMSPLFEVTFGTQEGNVKINEMLPAPGFEVAQKRAVQIAEERGLIIMGIIRSPWRVITEFVEFL